MCKRKYRCTDGLASLKETMMQINTYKKQLQACSNRSHQHSAADMQCCQATDKQNKTGAEPLVSSKQVR